MKYKIETDIYENCDIVQTLHNGLTDYVTKWICKTRDKEIKEALIKLGWTPPKDEFTSQSQQSDTDRQDT